MMKYYIFVLGLFIFSGCCVKKNLFYIQHTNVNEKELPVNCGKHFIEKINTTWLKHGKKPCHQYNIFAQGLAVIGSADRECVIGMEASMVKRLFGKPDEKQVGKFIYIFDDDCDDDMNTKPNAVFRKNLIFHYSSTDNKIKDITLVRGGNILN